MYQELLSFHLYAVHHLVNKYLLSTHSASTSVLGARDTKLFPSFLVVCSFLHLELHKSCEVRAVICVRNVLCATETSKGRLTS